MMRRRTRKALAATLLAMTLPLAGFAEAYDLPAGQSDEIKANATYTSMSIAGDLTVSGKTTVTLPTDQKDNVSIPGGTLTVGSGAKVGAAGKNSSNWVLSPDAETQQYGKITLNGGTAAMYTFKIAAGGIGADGYIDILRLNGGTFSPYLVQNSSSLTGRVTVVASSTIQHGTGYTYGAGTFSVGATAVVLANGSTFTFDCGQGGSLNEDGVPVQFSGTGDVKFLQYVTTAQKHPCTFRNGARFNHAGKLILSGTTTSESSAKYVLDADDAIGPNVTGISLAGTKPVSITLNSGTKQTVWSFDCYRANYEDQLIGTGTLCIDAATADSVFGAKIPGTSGVTIEKTGAYEVTAVGVTNYPALKVLEGRFVIDTDCAIGSLTIGEGATLVLDGATATTRAYVNEGGAVEYQNGGKLDLRKTTDDGQFEEVRRFCNYGSSVFTKEGAGALRLYDPVLTGMLHVAQGKLSFSRLGLTDRYMKFTFKELLPFDNKPVGNLRCRVYFYDEHSMPTRESSTWISNYEAGKDPSKLSLGEVTAPIGSTYDGNKPFTMFRDYSSEGTGPQWTRCAITNAADSGCWQVVWFRVSNYYSSSLDGINVYSPWNYGNPKVWMVESSPTGKDGTWRTILDKDERCAGMNTKNYAALNGDLDTPAYLLSYEQVGVRGLADTLAVQVDDGATLDFSMKTGGQGINRIVYESALGGGTISNVAIVANGTLEIVGELGQGQPLPLTLADVRDVGNFKSWTVMFNGQVKQWKINFVGDRIWIEKGGLMLIFR